MTAALRDLREDARSRRLLAISLAALAVGFGRGVLPRVAGSVTLLVPGQPTATTVADRAEGRRGPSRHPLW